ncbi:MAG: hypothetical protein IPK26_15960 [Planctomycetes bacterium]|nr:hypothetical protein [Planctomycetota bacterium]
MTRQQAQQLLESLVTLHEQLDQDRRLHTEEQRARREFFGELRPPAVPATDPKELRFLEWFLLEREAAVLGDVPFSTVPAEGAFAVLEGSLVGVFSVHTAVGGVAEALDLQDGETLELAVPEGALRPGDLLVGRLYTRDDNWLPSAAVAVFRPGVNLAAAFRRDVERLDLPRRLHQGELERLLLRPHAADVGVSPTATPGGVVRPEPAVPLEHLEAELDQLLERAGAEVRAAAVSQELEQAVRPGPVIGPLLEELAFDTDIDLDRARELLLQIWNAHHREVEPTVATAEVLDTLAPPAVPGETLGEQLVRTLEEGIAQHRDLGEVFAQMERMAGIEPDAEDDDRNPFDDDADAEELDVEDEETDASPDVAEQESDDDAGSPADFGDLQPLVEEFLWESGADPESGEARTLRLWAELQGHTGSRRDLEAVTAQDLMRLFLHVWLAQAPKDRANAVRGARATIEAFYAWAEQTQELPPQPAPKQCQGALLDDLDRLQGVGVALSTPAPRVRLQPGLLRVEEVGPRGFGVRDDDGGSWWIDAGDETVAALRVGDLLLGALVPGTAKATLRGMVVALPADAEALMG